MISIFNAIAIFTGVLSSFLAGMYVGKAIGQQGLLKELDGAQILRRGLLHVVQDGGIVEVD